MEPSAFTTESKRDHPADQDGEEGDRPNDREDRDLGAERDDEDLAVAERAQPKQVDQQATFQDNEGDDYTSSSAEGFVGASD